MLNEQWEDLRGLRIFLEPDTLLPLRVPNAAFSGFRVQEDHTFQVFV